MGVRLLFFGVCSQWLECQSLEVECAASDTVSKILERTPALERICQSRAGLQVAVNLEYAGFDAEVKDGDEVAFLPPVSGG